VVAEALKEGFTAYNAAGEKITGAIPLSSWEQLQQKVRNNYMSDINIGDQYGCLYGQSSIIVWEVVGKNIDESAEPNLTNSLTLRTSTLTSPTMFDVVEALYACRSEALSAGNYHYKKGSKYYIFTLTQSVPVGGQLVCTDNSTLISYSSGSSTTPIETVSVTSGGTGTNLGTLANNTRSGNLNTDYRRQLGSNDWKESAIRQWLNSDKPSGQWWEPQTPWDRPPTNSWNGWMSYLDPEFLAVVGKTKVTTNKYDTERGQLYDVYTTEDYFFLASTTQVGFINGPEGNKYAPFSDNASRVMYRNGSAYYYWLRSATTGSGTVSIVNTDGSQGAYQASATGNALAIFCNII
jgi:hypothetical protein